MPAKATVTVHTLEQPELAAEIRRLQTQLGIDHQEASRLEVAGALTGDQYTLLTRIRDLQWLADTPVNQSSTPIPPR